jgi:hypothetical protein
MLPREALSNTMVEGLERGLRTTGFGYAAKQIMVPPVSLSSSFVDESQSAETDGFKRVTARAKCLTARVKHASTRVDDE